jgi:hypothetical protein
LSCGVRSLQQAPWWDAERRARSDLRAAAPLGADGWTTRLSAFRFLAFFLGFPFLAFFLGFVLAIRLCEQRDAFLL